MSNERGRSVFRVGVVKAARKTQSWKATRRQLLLPMGVSIDHISKVVLISLQPSTALLFVEFGCVGPRSLKEQRGSAIKFVSKLSGVDL